MHSSRASRRRLPVRTGCNACKSALTVHESIGRVKVSCSLCGRFGLAMALVAAIGCGHAGKPTVSNASTSAPVRSSLRCDGYVPTSPGYSCFQRVGEDGFRCSGYVARGHTPRPDLAPVNYPVRDIGMPGVPSLSNDERATIDGISRATKSESLRFALLPPQRGVSGSLVVFDAVAGPCDQSAPGYLVLNKRRLDLPADQRYRYDLYYQPGENPYIVHSMSW